MKVDAGADFARLLIRATKWQIRAGLHEGGPPWRQRVGPESGRYQLMRTLLVESVFGLAARRTLPTGGRPKLGPRRIGADGRWVNAQTRQHLVIT